MAPTRLSPEDSLSPWVWKPFSTWATELLLASVDLPMLLMVFLSLLSFPIGDAPFCTPEQHKECAEPALGQYWENRGRGG